MSTKRRGKGEGGVYRPTYRDKRTGEARQQAVWWIRYRRTRGAKETCESSGSTDRRAASRLLAQRLADVSRGKAVGPEVTRTTFDDVARMLEDDYRVNARRSERRMLQSLTHLRAFFADMRAADIGPDTVTAYARQRVDAGAKNATVNRELSALKRAFHLAKIAGRVADVPHVSMLREADPRRGFFEPDELTRVLAHLPEDVRGVVHVAYITGWRVPSEVLTRQWRHVDFKAGFLRLDPGETKNGRGRMFPLIGPLRAVLEEQRRRTDALEAATGSIVPWVFWRSKGAGVPEAGARVGLFRKAWLRACAAAGVPGRILHDFRRTAVRNLERGGVPRTTAMSLVGHQTESIYRRYAIVDEAMLNEGAAKLERLLDAQQQDAAGTAPRIVPFAVNAKR